MRNKIDFRMAGGLLGMIIIGGVGFYNVRQIANNSDSGGITANVQIGNSVNYYWVRSCYSVDVFVNSLAQCLDNSEYVNEFWVREYHICGDCLQYSVAHGCDIF